MDWFGGKEGDWCDSCAGQTYACCINGPKTTVIACHLHARRSDSSQPSLGRVLLPPASCYHHSCIPLQPHTVYNNQGQRRLATHKAMGRMWQLSQSHHMPKHH